MDLRRRNGHFTGGVLVIAVVALIAGCAPADPDSADDGGDTALGDDTGGDTDENGEGGGDTAANGEATGGTLSVGTTADVVNYNPLVGNSRTDTWVTNLMYPAMMSLDMDAEKIPWVATDWGYSDDGLTATATIRDDLTWTDGEPLTADDIVFTIEAIAAEGLGTVAGMISAFESAEAVSDTEVAFNLSRPDGAFITSVGFWMPIVPAHVFGEAEVVGEFANDSDWVSAGPFVLTEVDQGQRYVLDAVENFPFVPEGRPALDRVEFRVFPDVNTAALALRNGDLDVIANALPPAQVDQLANEDGLTVEQVPSLGWAHMQYNMRRAPLDQLEVRQALAHAVDYEAIRNVVLGGNAVSARSSVLTPTFGFWHDESVEEYEFDPELSRELLEDAGFEDSNGDGLYDDLSFDMVYDQGDANISGWAELVRDQSADAGIDIQLNGLERNTYLERTQERDFDIYAGSWAVIDEPQSNFGLLFDSDGFINYAGVDDPEVEALLEEASAALTPEEALEPLQEVNRIVRDQVYDNVMYVEQFNFARSDAWTDWETKPSDLLSLISPQSLSQVRAAE